MVIGLTGRLLRGQGRRRARPRRRGASRVIDADALGHEALGRERPRSSPRSALGAIAPTGAWTGAALGQDRLRRSRGARPPGGHPASRHDGRGQTDHRRGRAATSSSTPRSCTAWASRRSAMPSSSSRRPPPLRLLRAMRRDRLSLRDAWARINAQKDVRPQLNDPAVDTYSVRNWGSMRSLERRVARARPALERIGIDGEAEDILGRALGERLRRRGARRRRAAPAPEAVHGAPRHREPHAGTGTQIYEYQSATAATAARRRHPAPSGQQARAPPGQKPGDQQTMHFYIGEGGATGQTPAGRHRQHPHRPPLRPVDGSSPPRRPRRSRPARDGRQTGEAATAAAKTRRRKGVDYWIQTGSYKSQTKAEELVTLLAARVSAAGSFPMRPRADTFTACASARTQQGRRGQVPRHREAGAGPGDELHLQVTVDAGLPSTERRSRRFQERRRAACS